MQTIVGFTIFILTLVVVGLSLILTVTFQIALYEAVDAAPCNFRGKLVTWQL